ncbi:hypothetical protein kam1_957 [Methylacidiphilum kamchatkense Kam1]|uniref:Uncharacterized protein n=1 Tax=Methylacidiphilum kamchatkense Kam1 TaxID=1202785 RepID=A0A516TLV0_9BACT|nr:hypothetical protein kam1_957 [Methylacidiphilum kamchatkense Kam1]
MHFQRTQWIKSTIFTFQKLLLFLFALLLYFKGLRETLHSESRTFELTIEDTIITLVKDQKFHTFAFNGQVPGPLSMLNMGMT